MVLRWGNRGVRQTLRGGTPQGPASMLSQLAVRVLTRLSCQCAWLNTCKPPGGLWAAGRRRISAPAARRPHCR